MIILTPPTTFYKCRNVISQMILLLMASYMVFEHFDKNGYHENQQY